MLRRCAAFLLKNESAVFRSKHLSFFCTSSAIHRKFKNDRGKSSCDPICVAVILCGCGYLDGTDIPEAMSAAIHISQKKMKPCFYAPDVNICETIDHCTKEPECNNSSRNALVEAARMTRTSIKSLCECKACEHGALVIPGGFGVTKTLSNYAEKGTNCNLLPDFEKIIEEFICAKKPIGSICIASVLLARVLQGVRITLGKDRPSEDWPRGDAIQKAIDMGAKVDLKNVDGVTKCKKYNVISTPACMYERATYADVYASVGKLINMLRKCIN